MKEIIQRKNIGCVIGHDYALGEDPKILAKARYIIDPWVNNENVFYWGIDLQSNFGVLIAEHLQKRQTSTIGYWGQLKIIVVVPSRAWVEERSGNEKLQMVIKKADKTAYLGTDKPEEVWKHLIKQSGYMLTFSQILSISSGMRSRRHLLRTWRSAIVRHTGSRALSMRHSLKRIY